MDKKKEVYTRGSMIVIAAGIILIAVIFCADGVKTKVRGHIMDNMQVISEQNALVIDSQIESIQKLMVSMSYELQKYSGEDKDTILQYLESYVDVYGLKRIGFAYPNGMAYTTDGYRKDLSFRTFFKNGMQGHSCISGVITDVMGEPEDIIVFSVPVCNQTGNKIVGVLFLTFRSDMLWKQLKVTSMNGEAESFVVRSDGTLLTSFKGNFMNDEFNIFKAMRHYPQENRKAVEQIQSDMKQRNFGRTVIFDEARYFLSYVPIDTTTIKDDETWYVVTLVQESLLEERLKVIWSEMERLIAILVTTLLFVLIGYVYSYRKQQKILTKLAYCDPVTQGDNYESFKEKQRNNKDMSGFLVTMDIKEFRNINNICGEKIGDDVIRSIWQVLLENVRPHELKAHISADRYIMFFEIDNREILSVRIENLTKEINKIAQELNTPRIMPYFGIYETFHSETLEKEYSCANQAKALAKLQKAPNYAFYEDVNIEEQMEKQLIESRFLTAIDNREFEVWFQPKYNPDDDSIVGAEALVRWRKEDGTLIPPNRFIPLFEQNGMIAKLDTYMFEMVCVQQRKWKDKFGKTIPVSVNVSRASLYCTDIVERYKRILEKFKLTPKYIHLEITESATIKNSEIHRLVQEFHAAGFCLLLDDFGNGYSSLASLNDMQFDVLKLDKSLIDHIGEHDGEKLLKYIIKLAHSLRLEITAEGVENQEQVDFLRKLKCDNIQGFYYSKPLPVGEFELLL